MTSMSDALAAAFSWDGEIPEWDGETLVLDPRLRLEDCRTWDDYVAVGRIGVANVTMMLARPDYRRAWMAAYDVAHGLAPGDPDPVDAVLDVVPVDEEAAMFAVWVAEVPERYRRAGLSDYALEVGEAVRTWADGRVQRPGLVVAGPTGTGKTRLGYAIARHLFVAREITSWRVMPMTMLLSLLRPGGDVETFGDMATLDLLVLDDVGAERPTDWTIEQIDALVDLRWRYGLPTVVTTNLPAPAFREHVGDRVHSRLVAGGKVLTLVGTDRRGDVDDGLDAGLVPDMDEPLKPGERCPRCHGQGFVDAPRSYIARTGHHAVIPCRVCKPEQYRRWAEGEYEPSPVSERRVSRSTSNAPSDEAPPRTDAPSDVPPEQPTLDLPHRADLE